MCATSFSITGFKIKLKMIYYLLSTAIFGLSLANESRLEPQTIQNKFYYLL